MDNNMGMTVALALTSVLTATAVVAAAVMLFKESGSKKNEDMTHNTGGSFNTTHFKKKKTSHKAKAFNAETAIEDLGLKKVSCGVQKGDTCWAHAACSIVNWYAEGEANENPIKNYQDVFTQGCCALGYNELVNYSFPNNSSYDLQFTENAQNHFNSLKELISPADSNITNLVKRQFENLVINDINKTIIYTRYTGGEIRAILKNNGIKSQNICFTSGNKKDCKDGVKLFLNDYFAEESSGAEQKPPIAVNLGESHWVSVMGRTDGNYILYDSLYEGYRWCKEKELLNNVVTRSRNNAGYATDIVVALGKVDNPDSINISDNSRFNCRCAGQEISELDSSFDVSIDGLPITAKVQLYKNIRDKYMVMKKNGTRILQEEGEDFAAFCERAKLETDLILNDSGQPKIDHNAAKGWVKYSRDGRAKGIVYYRANEGYNEKYFIVPHDLNVNIPKFNTEEELFNYISTSEFLEGAWVGVDDVDAEGNMNGNENNLPELVINNSVNDTSGEEV